MAYLNTDLATSVRAIDLSQPPGWIVGQFQFGASPTVTTGDVIDIFYNSTARGFFVADWWVAMEQVDTNGAPAVAFNIGVAGDATAISGTSGLRWDTGVTTLGRASNVSLIRASNGGHLLQNGHSNRIGLQCSVLPATAAWANKRIWMGMLLLPCGVM